MSAHGDHLEDRIKSIRIVIEDYLYVGKCSQASEDQMIRDQMAREILERCWGEP